MKHGLLNQVVPPTRKQRLAHKFMLSLCSILSIGLTATAAIRATSFEAPAVVRTVQDVRPAVIDKPLALAANTTSDTELLRSADAEPAAELASFSSVATPQTAILRPAAPVAPTSLSNLRHIRLTVTAYCPCKLCCGAGARGITASGKRVTYNGGQFVAADKSLFPFGTRFSIPGYHNGRPAEVIDTGSAIKGHHIDVFFPTHRQAAEWGVQTLDVTLAATEE